MAFSLREFVKNGFLNAVGGQPDYWIILNAAGYAEKGILTEDDLSEIQAAIGRKNQAAVQDLSDTNMALNVSDDNAEGDEK